MPTEVKEEVGIFDLTNRIGRLYGDGLGCGRLPDYPGEEMKLATDFLRKVADFFGFLRSKGLTNGGDGWAALEPEDLRGIAEKVSINLDPGEFSPNREILITALEEIAKTTGRLEFYWLSQSLQDD